MPLDRSPSMNETAAFRHGPGSWLARLSCRSENAGMKYFPLACLGFLAACAGSALPDDPAVDTPIVLAQQASTFPADSAPFCAVGYFPEWAVYAKHYTVDRIPADSLTHVNYAFAKVLANGSVEAWDAHAAFDRPSRAHPRY